MLCNDVALYCLVVGNKITAVRTSTADVRHGKIFVDAEGRLQPGADEVAACMDIDPVRQLPRLATGPVFQHTPH